MSRDAGSRGVFGVQSLIGQQLGDYTLEAELGRGSMGVVYRAQHVTQGKPYAVKVLLDALSSDMSFVTRFTREARIVSNLRHANIIRVVEAGRQSQHLFFVMEYFPGQTAGQMVRERGRIAPGQAVEIAAQAADALDYAHREGHLVHRDIKPENLLVDRWYRVKVLDFGLARVEGLHSITRAGTVVGSLYYVSPEQLLGQKLDGRTDVYALGVSLYEMLTGQRPYRGQTLTDMSQAILSGAAIPPSQLEAGVTPELERIVNKALARDLDQRYHSAGELHADLRALQTSMAETHVHAAQPPESAHVTERPAIAEEVVAQSPRMSPPAPAPRAQRGAIRPTALEPVTDPYPAQPPRQTMR